MCDPWLTRMYKRYLGIDVPERPSLPEKTMEEVDEENLKLVDEIASSWPGKKSEVRDE